MQESLQANGTFDQSSRALSRPAIGPGEARARQALLLIDGRVRDRECLVRSIAAKKDDMEAVALGTFAEWNRERDRHPPLAVVLLNIGGGSFSNPSVVSQAKTLVSEGGDAPVIVLADTDDLHEIFAAIDCGAKGFIPSTLGIAICVEAISLVMAGGIFMPASCVMNASRQMMATNSATAREESMFTNRQAEVVEGLKRGKANKIIAYELNMCESTVKVHVRNVMRKLKATNRTEVVYKLNEMLDREGVSFR